ncbi:MULTISPECIES: EAL domain-containing response regulator [Lysobacter]|uniref:EAL domain-containing response regulator n=1 Tax=Lysobacter firmicutimachus TaxID=1792846 RepID=A0ABU8CXH4_9GAMM|nr:EAL domain-containing response regulator [Lysobacter antibioticus]
MVASYGSSGLEILIVDDDPITAEVVAAVLRAAGETGFAVAHSGAVALQMSAGRDIDVLICDLNMPGTDGVWLLGRVAEFAVRPSVILISGEDSRVIDSSRQFVEERGMTLLGALQKPIESDALLRALRRHRSGGGATRERPSRPPFDPGRIRQGLAGDALRLAFQPKVNLADKTLAGAEALLRWGDPELGFIPACEIVDGAERIGLIDELTLAVLAKAAIGRGAMLARNLDVGISFNVSMKSLNNPTVVDRMVEVVAAAGDRFDRYTVEVTETHLMREPAKVLESLIRFRLRGFRIAIDDYGVGAAAMQFLMKLPSNELKIDRSFVAAAPISAQAYELLKSAVELGLRLGQVVVAEGVETEVESTLVQSLGCQQGQGYLYGPPMSLDELIRRHG